MENTPKLTLTQYEFLKNEVVKTMNDYSELRLGQTWFNELVAHLPQFGWIRTTKIDPFFRDEVLLDLFFHILDEEAYASWTHSDDYKKLHKEWVDKHPAVPVDTSGSELSDFVETEYYDPQNNNITQSYTIPDDWEKALEDSVKEDVERLIREAEEVKQKELKLMENETYMSPAGPTSNNEMPKGTPLPDEGATVVAAEPTPYVESTNIRLNLTTNRDPIQSIKLLQAIIDAIGSLENIQVRNLEISRW